MSTHNPVLSPNAHAIGIDLGGTTVRTGIYDREWNLLDCITLPTRIDDGPESVIGDMARCVNTLAENFGFSPITVGLGSPGPLNLREGRLLRLPNFPGWDYFPIRDALCEAIGFPVVLESDGNAAAFAELHLGAGAASNANSLCMLTLGTGVGSGLVLGRKIWHGRNGMAGEIGHVSIDSNGLACTCGGQGCLEQYASATAIALAGQQWLRDNQPDPLTNNRDLDKLTTRDLAQFATSGHRGMQQLFRDVGHHLGLAIAGVMNTLDLPLYVVGGGVADAWDLFAPSLFQAVHSYSCIYQLSESGSADACGPGRPHIGRAILGARAGLLGAALISRSEELI